MNAPTRRRDLGTDVFNEAINRLVEVYEHGHRVVVSFSTGKDSGVCVELAVIAATITNRLPVEVIMRDEEVMFPGSYEYAERIAARPEIDFHWIYARQPVINCFNRRQPYFWVFDPLLDPSDWLRQPPGIAYEIPEKNIDSMVTPNRFPPAEGKELFTVIGLRISESFSRRRGLFASKGHITKPQKYGVRRIRPIYDWEDGDVWKAILENQWDYNSAYDVLHRHGVKPGQLRIGPPTMNIHGASNLAIARTAWPQWFDKLEQRLPGVRTVAQFGRRAVTPRRMLGESWEQTFWRECVHEAPEWIAERAEKVIKTVLAQHSRHASTPFPQANKCYQCHAVIGSWKKAAETMYLGDPFAAATGGMLSYVEPEFFRPGSGTWGGSPTW